MGTYKKPCEQCGALIDGDVLFCPACGSRSPFGFLCPTCRKPIKKEYKVCTSCGRNLRVTCPHCGQETFVQDTCQVCGKSLLVQCSNRRCGDMQFFENKKCTSCGHKLKNKQK